MNEREAEEYMIALERISKLRQFIESLNTDEACAVLREDAGRSSKISIQLTGGIYDPQKSYVER